MSKQKTAQSSIIESVIASFDKISERFDKAFEHEMEKMNADVIEKSVKKIGQMAKQVIGSEEIVKYSKNLDGLIDAMAKVYDKAVDSFEEDKNIKNQVKGDAHQFGKEICAGLKVITAMAVDATKGSIVGAGVNAVVWSPKVVLAVADVAIKVFSDACRVIGGSKTRKQFCKDCTKHFTEFQKEFKEAAKGFTQSVQTGKFLDIKLQR